MTYVICVVGRGRRSGKTSLIEGLTKALTEDGFVVATVKNIHCSFDTPEKDTWKHLEAGASVTVATTPTNLIVIKKINNPTIDDVLKHIHNNHDILFVEGFKKSLYPKILCTNDFSDAKNMMKESSNIIMVSGNITNKKNEIEQFKQKFPEIQVYTLKEITQVLREILIKTKKQT
ncbi:MAG: molybdopterin-guanine dinucleotide biosynthesis protein B [Candidatus Lokiarchaeota archaeon]|nr:molybdopterin-guanine dinucleotide biosynthesis protein B [Candidatus Lokiarchaeota archaeon]